MSRSIDMAHVRVIKDTYADSLLLLVATSEMSQSDGVSWAGAVMATPAGRESLAAEGFGAELTGDVGSNDLVLAVRAQDEDKAEAAFETGLAAIAAEAADPVEAAVAAPRSIASAVALAGDSNVAIISVPGAYAALEAHQALSTGLHVLLFSDNVPVEEARDNNT